MASASSQLTGRSIVQRSSKVELETKFARQLASISNFTWVKSELNHPQWIAVTVALAANHARTFYITKGLISQIYITVPLYIS